MADGEKTVKKITITVKTQKLKESFETTADASVKEFREEVSKKFDTPVEQVCLIFAGKILKDQETITSVGIKDGYSVHLVIKSANKTDQKIPSATPGVLSNVEQFRHLVHNPAFQAMISNPEYVKYLFDRDPGFNDLVLRILPGGPNTAQRIFNEAHQRAQELPRRNPFSQLFGDAGTTQMGTLNCDPLPNPWSSKGSTRILRDIKIIASPGLRIFNSPGMDSLLQQIEQNAKSLQDMANALYTQNMFLGLAEEFHNPEVEHQTASPEVANAFRQLEESLQQIRQNLPAPQPGRRVVLTVPMPPSRSSNSAPAQPGATGGTTETNTTFTDAGAAAAAALGPEQQPPPPRPNDPTQSPEELYRPLVDQLVSMGFFSRDENLRALVASGGNLNAAVEYLLQRSFS